MAGVGVYDLHTGQAAAGGELGRHGDMRWIGVHADHAAARCHPLG
jgi:hypothetical protein